MGRLGRFVIGVESEAIVKFLSAKFVAQFLLMSAAVVFAATRVQAGILPYVQTSDYPNNFNAITSQSQATGGNYQSFDNFTVTTTGTIESLSWQGFFWNPTSQFFNPVTVASPTFQIGFFQNTNNLPNLVSGAIGGAISLNSLQVAQVGTANFGPDNTGNYDLVKILNFTANLNTPFTALANTTYWLSIVSFTSTAPAVWLWDSGQGGDGKSAQYNYGQPNPVNVVGDRTFSMSSGLAQPLLGALGPAQPPTGLLEDSVPEPGSLAIMGTLLLGGVAASFWRRKMQLALTSAAMAAVVHGASRHDFPNGLAAVCNFDGPVRPIGDPKFGADPEDRIDCGADVRRTGRVGLHVRRLRV